MRSDAKTRQRGGGGSGMRYALRMLPSEDGWRTARSARALSTLFHFVSTLYPPPSPPHRSPSRSLCDPAYRGRSNPYGRDRGSVRANGSETAIDGPKCKVVDVPCVNRLENLQIAQTEGTTAGRRKYSSRMRRKVSAICDSRNESTSPTSPERSPRGDPPLA